MNYNDWVAAAQNTLSYATTDTEFLEILPRMIEYAELRIYKELDFLATLGSQSGVVLTANNRNIQLPANVVVCESLNVITPASAGSPDAGTRNPLERVSVDFLNAVYVSGTSPAAALPQKYAIIGLPSVSGATITAGSYNILLGPTPDQAYPLEVIGTLRPSPLSPANLTTFLSTYCPDLFFAATMIFGAGYQQNFGSQSDNPQLSQSWESQYQALKGTTDVESLRMKAASVSWSSRIPTPAANMARDRNAQATP